MRPLQRVLLATSTLGAISFVVGACGNENPNTTPTNPVASSSAHGEVVAASATPIPSASTGPTASAGATEPATEKDPCEGADLDLAAMLSDRGCHPKRDAAPTPKDAPSLVKVTLTTSSGKVAPGGHVDLNLDVVNTGAIAIPLYFAGDLTLTPTVIDAKGKQIAPPSGEAPKNPDPSCAKEAQCRRHASHVVIAPGGHAHAKIGWDANKVAWPKVGPTTCCTVHVDSIANGPLAAGTYKIKVPLPYEDNQGNPADAEVTINVAK